MDKTLDQLKEELDSIETSDFYLQMKDHWSQEDFHTHDVYQRKITELKAQINEMEEKK